MIHTILRCLRNNLIRNFSNNLGIICSMFIVPLVVIASFYVTKLNLSSDTIATLNVNQNFIEYLNDNNISYSQLNDYPTKFEIYTQKFNGVIQYEGNEYKTFSYKGNAFKKELDSIVDRKYSKVAHNTKTSSISLAIFHASSILLIQTVLNMKLFIDDRKNGVLQRLRIVGVKDYQYLSSYFLFNWLSVAFPFTLATVLSNNYFLGSNVKIDLEIITICFIITVLFSMLALLICTIVRDNTSAIMVGNIVACFSILLSGMFGSPRIYLLNRLGDFMPQKIAYSWFKIVVENHTILNHNLAIILSVCILSFFVSKFLFTKLY